MKSTAQFFKKTPLRQTSHLRIHAGLTSMIRKPFTQSSGKERWSSCLTGELGHVALESFACPIAMS